MKLTAQDLEYGLKKKNLSVFHLHQESPATTFGVLCWQGESISTKPSLAVTKCSSRPREQAEVQCNQPSPSALFFKVVSTQEAAVLTGLP